MYGYESYSTLTLYKAQNFLENTNNKIPKSRMLVYEKVNERVRYLKKDLLKGNTIVVYVMGISSTLSTFKQMNDAFVKACKKEKVDLESDNNKSKIDSMCLSIIQIVGHGCEKFISFTNGSNYLACKSNDNYIDFALGQQAYCFVTAESKWYAAEQQVCQLCLPEQAQEQKTMFDESPLIEVDDTSVVPTQMIFLNKANRTKNDEEDVKIDDSCGKENAVNFLENEDNREYLRYGHIERCDNHFQYFFRIAELYHDKQKLAKNVKEIGIEDWLIKLKEKYAKAFDTDDKSVNILIAPQHFSNTGYVNSVAKCVFGDTAHIIELDIRKEYRSNFRTKYSNYRELSKYMDLNKKDNQYRLNFYYVNDQIISGRTFKRAESLINTLLGKRGDSQKEKIFKGVFTIVDRNSYETRKAFVEPINDGDTEYLPFFSYLRFDVPSLRNHDNSCPLCAQNKVAEDIVASSAFTSSVHYWQKKIVYHKQRTSDEMRDLNYKHKENNLKEYNNIKTRNFRRLQCENEIWQEITKSNDADITFYNILCVILNRKKHLIKTDSTNKGKRRKEKLSKALKTADAALGKIKDALKTLEADVCLSDNEADRNSADRKEILNNIIDELKDFNIIYEFPIKVLKNLFNVTIARLCAVGSCALLNKKRLYACCVIGNYLEQESKKSQKLGIVPKGIELPPESFDNEGYETRFGEYLISYLKVISKPLLFYREPVKKAVLKLLLLIFDKLLKLEDDISVDNIKIKDKEDEADASEYYDETFNGFLLNKLKRLLCYDKGLSKCNYCDNYALKDSSGALDFNGEFSGFFKRLYIENNRAARKESEPEIKENWQIFDPDSIRTFDDKGEIKLKYKYITEQLRRHCCNNGSEVKIAFFTANEVKNNKDDREIKKKECYKDEIKFNKISHTFIGGDEEVKAPQINEFNDFYYDGGIYYARIGNNFKRFKDDSDDQKDCKFPKDVYDSYQELNLMQDAYVIIGVKTNELSTLRKIIAFRKEILREVEKDFNNGTVRKSIFFQIMTEALVRPEASSHNVAAHEAYHLAFENVLSKNKDTKDFKSRAEAQYHIISAYSSLIISEYYRHLVKRSIKNNNDVAYTIEQEGAKNPYHIKFDIKSIQREKRAENEQDFYDVSPYITYLLEMLKHHKYSLNLEICYGYNEDYEVLDLESETKRFEDFFEDYKIQNLFPYINQYFYMFMILDILIKNVESHCPEELRGEDFKVIVRFTKNDKGNIDLSVENKYNKKWDEDYKGSGITLYALANLFGTVDLSPKYCDPQATLYYTGLDGNKPQDDEYNFVARLDNFIIIQN